MTITFVIIDLSWLLHPWYGFAFRLRHKNWSCAGKFKQEQVNLRRCAIITCEHYVYIFISGGVALTIALTFSSPLLQDKTIYVTIHLRHGRVLWRNVWLKMAVWSERCPGNKPWLHYRLCKSKICLKQNGFYGRRSYRRLSTSRKSLVS